MFATKIVKNSPCAIDTTSVGIRSKKHAVIRLFADSLLGLGSHISQKLIGSYQTCSHVATKPLTAKTV